MKKEYTFKPFDPDYREMDEGKACHLIKDLNAVGCPNNWTYDIAVIELDEAGAVVRFGKRAANKNIEWKFVTRCFTYLDTAQDVARELANIVIISEEKYGRCFVY